MRQNDPDPKEPGKTDTAHVASAEPRHFRLCSSCKRPLEFAARYYICSVSTCNRARNPLTFCSLPCFEAHVPMLRHREAWAEEKQAPSREQFLAERAEAAASEQSQASSGAKVSEDWRVTTTARDKQPPEHVVDTERLGRAALNRSPGVITRAPSIAKGMPPAASKELPMSNEEVPKEVLVVISKVKAYIRAKSTMNTSDAVTEALSELVRSTCDQAIEKAKSEGRKTVMARDIGPGGAPE
jgi:hypothetical protein